MKKVSNTEAELKKALLIKKKRVGLKGYPGYKTITSQNLSS